MLLYWKVKIKARAELVVLLASGLVCFTDDCLIWLMIDLTWHLIWQLRKRSNTIFLRKRKTEKNNANLLGDILSEEFYPSESRQTFLQSRNLTKVHDQDDCIFLTQIPNDDRRMMKGDKSITFWTYSNSRKFQWYHKYKVSWIL